VPAHDFSWADDASYREVRDTRAGLRIARNRARRQSSALSRAAARQACGCASIGCWPDDRSTIAYVRAVELELVEAVLALDRVAAIARIQTKVSSPAPSWATSLPRPPLITIRLHAYQEGATIVLVFCAALVWTWWGTIDIVASATGKILPGGRTKVVQPFETGVVRSAAKAPSPRSSCRRRRWRSDREMVCRRHHLAPGLRTILPVSSTSASRATR
jgi:hypothetical protein